jgi:hypothetical protein
MQRQRSRLSHRLATNTTSSSGHASAARIQSMIEPLQVGRTRVSHSRTLNTSAQTANALSSSRSCQNQ